MASLVNNPMKSTLTLVFPLLFSALCFADGFSFEDDAPVGFLHLTQAGRDPALDPVDYFIPASSIVEIRVDSNHRNDKDKPITQVTLRTSGSQPQGEGSTSRAYWLSFKTKEEALRFARGLMRKINQRKHGVAGQLVIPPRAGD